MPERIIFTLGTGKRTISEFISILKSKNIDVLLDVRRFPTSRFEDFQKDNLSQHCIKNKIDYIYLGTELGGYRKGGYEEYTKTTEFKKGIERLVEIASKRKVCIVCAETLPWKCHRRFIGARLYTMGYQVIHLIDERHTWEPENVSYD
ncbi:MAG: DUF488 domain-containing protein [candidate division WOR-3 bacterium]